MIQQIVTYLYGERTMERDFADNITKLELCSIKNLF